MINITITPYIKLKARNVRGSRVAVETTRYAVTPEGLFYHFSYVSLESAEYVRTIIAGQFNDLTLEGQSRYSHFNSRLDLQSLKPVEPFKIV